MACINFRTAATPNAVLLPGIYSDLVVAIRTALALTVSEGRLVMRGRGRLDYHYGWTLLCALNWIVFSFTLGPLGFAVWAASPLVWVLFPLIYAGAGQSGDQRRLAEASRGLLAYDRDRDEVVASVPLPAVAIPNPFVAPGFTFATLLDGEQVVREHQARTLPPLGQLTITAVGFRAGRARIGFRLTTFPVAGCLMVRSRPPNNQRSPIPPANMLANWTFRLSDWSWQYRSCDDPEPRITVAMRISNRVDTNEPFPSNALHTMDVCPVEFDGPVRRLMDGSRHPRRRLPVRTFALDWLDNTDRVAVAPPRFILPNSSYTFILSISWSDLIAIRDRAVGFGEDRDIFAAQFLVAPGFVVLRTSAGRRMIRLPSFDLNRLGNERERLMVSPRLDCGSQRNWRTWGGIFAGRAGLGRRIGPDPFILVDRLLDDSVRADLPRLTLPLRNGGGLLSLEHRSVDAVLGRGSPNAFAFAGLPPSNLNDIPAPMAAPIGLARLPRRP